MTMETLHPIGPWVLVRPLPFAETSPGGIVRVVDNAEDRFGMAEGLVVNSGPGKSRCTKRSGVVVEPTGVSRGDRIMFRSFLKDANKPRPLDSDNCLIHMDDILGVVE